jgi:putative tryptophan/tyrosine transport system substrate-binding protein
MTSVRPVAIGIAARANPRMNRRRFLIAAAGAFTWSRSALAQVQPPFVVASLGVARFLFDADNFPPRLDAAMRTAGWQAGRDYRFVPVASEGGNQALPALARELVAQQPSIIIPFGDGAIRAAQASTTTIPIAAIADDMVGSGLVASMAHPGSNTTGISILASELDTKRLELLHELAPKATRLGVLADPTTVSTRLAVERAGGQLGVDLVFAEVKTLEEAIAAIDTMADSGAGAINVLASPLLHTAGAAIMGAVAHRRLPAIYQWPEQAAEGALIAYGPRLSSCYQLLAAQAVRLLQGAKPADLPVQQPTRFELVINLKTAQALDLTVPQSILARADEVIE